MSCRGRNVALITIIAEAGRWKVGRDRVLAKTSKLLFDNISCIAHAPHQTLLQLKGRRVSESQWVMTAFDTLLRVERIRLRGRVLMMLREAFDVIFGKTTAVPGGWIAQKSGIVKDDGLLRIS